MIQLTRIEKLKAWLDEPITISWDRFFQKEPDPYTIFQVKPSRSVRNNQAYLVAKVVAGFYRPAKELYSLLNNGTLLRVRSPYRTNFRIVMQANEIGFFLIVPNDKAQEILRKVEGIYDSSITIEKVDSLPKIDAARAFCTELHYKKHDIFSLDTDRSNNYPLPSILTAVRTLQGDDLAIFDAMLEPYQREAWAADTKDAYGQLDRGYIPSNSPGGVIFRAVNDAINILRYELADLFAITQEQKAKAQQCKLTDAGYQEAKRLHDSLSNATKRKQDDEILKTWIRIAVHSDDVTRARSAAYSLANAFSDIKADNELTRVDIPAKWVPKYVEAIEQRKPVAILSTPLKMSIEEAGKLMQLPGDTLLSEFPEVVSKNLKDVHLPDELTQDDIPHIRLGKVVERGHSQLACFPLIPYGDVSQKAIYDALCTASFGQGKQGTGKSEGYGSTWAYDMVVNGYSVIIIDTADGQVLRNFINALPEDYPEDQIHALNMDNRGYPIALGWNDIYGRDFSGDDELQALEISERITSRFISFINSLSNTGDFTDRMQQYVKSCMRAITTSPTWSFLDLELSLTSPGYREELLQSDKVQEMPDVVLDLSTLQERAAAGKEGEIINPILSRIKQLAGTQFMTNLFYQDPKIKDDGRPVLDLREIMDNESGGKYGHVVAIQASYDAWNDDQATILGFMLDKINFNAFSRVDQEQKDRRPCLVWIDEPHKVIKNIEGSLTGTAVEFRKYRIKNLFTGHSIDQMGKAADALLQGGAQITSYKTEKLNEFTRFAHQFAPYTDAQDLYEALPEKWRAINTVRLPSGKPCPAFIADMPAPPKEVKDRSEVWQISAERYGRPWKEVRDTIQQKRAKYIELDKSWKAAQEEAAIIAKAATAEALKAAKKLKKE